MNKEQFISFFENPSLIDNQSSKELQQLVEQYPYFQSARIVFLKSLFDNKSISYQSELKITATYAGNRALLQSYILNKTKHTQESSYGIIPEQTVENQNKTNKRTEIEFDFIDPFIIQQGFELPTVTEEPKEFVNEKKKQQIEIINRFINTEPRIVPKDIPVEQAHDLSDESASDTEFLTETLADIYVKQKKYEKAIEMFQKLSLKFPQKSVYFASRVSEIKSIINQDKK